MHEAIGASNDRVTFQQAPFGGLSFERALAAVRIAREACNAYDREVIVPLIEAQEEGLATLEEVQAAEDAWTPYTTAYVEATDALLLTPAPTFKAMLTKLELACEALDVSEGTKVVLESFAHDLRRLARVGGEA